MKPKKQKKTVIRIRKALENRTNMEDDRVALLEQQLAQAKLIAEEADKKYEEVGLMVIEMQKMYTPPPTLFYCVDDRFVRLWWKNFFESIFGQHVCLVSLTFFSP